MFAPVRHEVFCGKIAERSTDLLLLWFSKVIFLVANQLFSEGVINSETGSPFSICRDFNKHSESSKQAPGPQHSD